MSTVEVYALKPFLYSTNGYTEIPVKQYETFHLPEYLFAGLNDARYVRRARIGDPTPAPVVEVAVEPEEIAEEESAAPEIVSLPPASTRKQQAAVEIPDDWQTLKFFALRSLAAKVSDVPIKTMSDAIAAIEAELARRG